MIPEILRPPDLQLRLDLYRRLAGMEDLRAPSAEFGIEMVDRFGEKPSRGRSSPAGHCRSRCLCRRANVEKVEGGAKGITALLPRTIPSPIRAASSPMSPIQGPTAKVRADMKIVFMRDVPISTAA